MKLLQILAAATTAASLVSIIATPSQAANLFGNSGIKFDKDTTVNFDFLESHGIYKSYFGVQQVGGSFISLLQETQNADNQSQSVNDWLGTCGISVKECTSSFTFKAGLDYNLVLQSYEKVPINRSWGYQSTPTQTVSSSSPASTVFTQNSETSYTLAWDDGHPSDKDTNDFFVKASWEKTASVPEPATLAGLGLVGSFLAIKGRRKIDITR